MAASSAALRRGQEKNPKPTPWDTSHSTHTAAPPYKPPNSAISRPSQAGGIVGWVLIVLGILIATGVCVSLLGFFSPEEWAIHAKALINLPPNAFPLMFTVSVGAIALLVLALGVMCLRTGNRSNPSLPDPSDRDVPTPKPSGGLSGCPCIRSRSSITPDSGSTARWDAQLAEGETTKPKTS